MLEGKSPDFVFHPIGWASLNEGHQTYSKFTNKIHETILAIDSELNTALDGQYRERLVKAVYALRNLEEAVQNA